MFEKKSDSSRIERQVLPHRVTDRPAVENRAEPPRRLDSPQGCLSVYGSSPPANLYFRSPFRLSIVLD